MKQHIEIVKKWLTNPESVSQKELQDNRDAAIAAAYAVTDYDGYAYAAIASAAAAGDASDAAKWIKRNEEQGE